MKKYLVVATKGELRLPWAECEKDREVIVTGVGGANVIRALKDLPRDSDILNVGWCGSAYFPIGYAVWVRDCRLWHPGVSYQEPIFQINDWGNALCLTAGDFVNDGSGLPEKSVVDMELAYIASFGFAKLSAVKVVSDRCDLSEYERTTK